MESQSRNCSCSLLLWPASPRRWTYGLVLLLHGLTTLISYAQYLHPFEKSNILFFAAWPMLAACFALYYLRDLDTLWTFAGPPNRSKIE